MSLSQLSLAAARNLHLAAQGLLKKPRRRAQPADILSTVQRMSLLQIDTINIVARSPYLVLFSRLGNYPPQWLDNALSQGELMEYWAHEACFSTKRFCSGASPHARPGQNGLEIPSGVDDGTRR